MAKLLDYITSLTAVHQSGDFIAESITIHWWGVPSSHRKAGTFDGTARYLASDNDRDSSIHFIVSALEKKLACLVDLDHAAWHSGNWTGNHRSVGIECRPWDASTPKAEIEAEMNAVAYAVALIWHWRPKLKGSKLKGHLDWYATACPGSYYPRLEEIRRRALALYPRVDPDRPGYLIDANPGGGTVPPADVTPTEGKLIMDANDEKRIAQIVRAELSHVVGDVVPNPGNTTNPTVMVRSALGMLLDRQIRERQSVAILEAKVDAIAAKMLTPAEIEAASTAGAKAALDARISDADVTLTVTGGE